MSSIEPDFLFFSMHSLLLVFVVIYRLITQN